MSFAMYSSRKWIMENMILLKTISRTGCRESSAMTNRGPVRYDPDGRLDQNILDEYRRNGFYVFTEVLKRKS